MNTVPETTVVHLWEREMKMEEGGSDRGRKNKNAGRPKVKLSIKGEQQHPSNFYFSKYKVSTIVHTKPSVLRRSGSEKAPKVEVHMLSATT